MRRFVLFGSLFLIVSSVFAQPGFAPPPPPGHHAPRPTQVPPPPPGQGAPVPPVGQQVRILPNGAEKISRGVYVHNQVYYKKVGINRYKVVPQP